jgi:hypothetical protein
MPNAIDLSGEGSTSMAVTVEEMLAEKSWWMRWRCRRLERLIQRKIRAQWSPGAKVFFGVPRHLIDDYTVAHMKHLFSDWNIEHWYYESAVKMRVSEKVPMPYEQAVR